MRSCDVDTSLHKMPHNKNYDKAKITSLKLMKAVNNLECFLMNDNFPLISFIQQFGIVLTQL